MGLRTPRTPPIPIHSPFVLPPSGVIPSPLSTLNTIHSIKARYLSTVPCTIENILCLPNNVGLGAMKTSDVVVVVGAPLKDLAGRRMGEAGVRVLNHWGASQIGPIRPIEYVKPGYHAWRYLSPRTDLGFRFVPKDHDRSDEENNGEEQRRTYALVFGLRGGRRISFLRIYFGLLFLKPRMYDLQHDLNPIPHCTPSPSTSLNPTKLYKILSRTDTLLIPSYGEKVKPELAERLISEHPDVRGVLAFGEGEVGIGVVAELRGRGVVGGSHPHLNKKGEAGESEHGIFTYIDYANLLLDAHAQIPPELVVFTFKGRKPLVRTDKGSITRNASYCSV
ncbi:hypothetical protein K443DRAFT_475678 [Laccaria amethystina LaAM-08-1]|uniref:Uncharacterized protein n=1 Tax=Laccaria amethystina LaAM-08-1 TaxID=1095629 RepID=A0A0C9X556_9AGAR|nr:hypothetical protein K443DRAFT_475678 [Laccaria amethystina LaAM-08-1]